MEPERCERVWSVEYEVWSVAAVPKRLCSFFFYLFLSISMLTCAFCFSYPDVCFHLLSGSMAAPRMEDLGLLAWRPAVKAALTARVVSLLGR